MVEQNEGNMEEKWMMYGDLWVIYGDFFGDCWCFMVIFGDFFGDLCFFFGD